MNSHASYCMIWNIERLSNGWHVRSDDNRHDYQYKDGQVVSYKTEWNYSVVKKIGPNLRDDELIEMTEGLIKEKAGD